MRTSLGRRTFLVCLGASVAAACTGSAQDPAASTSPTAPTVGMSPATSAGGSTLPPTPTTGTGPRPAPTVEGSSGGSQGAATVYDYRIAATEQVIVDSPLGRIRWLRTSVVPSEWLYAGFPTPSFVADPFSYERSWQTAASGAPCCLSITRTATGWLGVGDTDRAGGASCGSSTEVWTSDDGEAWDLLTADGFGDAGPCDISRVVESGGSAAVIGVGEAGSGGTVGAVWVSSDLRHWIRRDLDFEREGVDTFVTSVIASSRGFALFGMRVSHEPTARSEAGIRLGSYPFEWAGWWSTDGIDWKPINIAKMFGYPWCKPNHPMPCGRIEATVIADGIIAYVHQAADSTIPDVRDGWALWIGLFGE